MDDITKTELFSMDIHQLSVKYGSAPRIVKLWLQGLQLDTLTPQLADWVSNLCKQGKDKFMEDIEVNSDTLFSMNFSSIAVHYGTTNKNVRLWVQSRPITDTMATKVKDWVDEMVYKNQVYG